MNSKYSYRYSFPIEYLFVLETTYSSIKKKKYLFEGEYENDGEIIFVNTCGFSSSYFNYSYIPMTCSDLKVKMYGKVTVGPKSQIVIPKDVRDLLHIAPGDDLMIITKGDMAIAMIKADDVPKFLQYIKSELQQ